MKLYAKCGSCNKKKFFVKKRNYNIPKIGNATSKEILCFSCYKIIKDINKALIKSES